MKFSRITLIFLMFIGMMSATLCAYSQTDSTTKTVVTHSYTESDSVKITMAPDTTPYKWQMPRAREFRTWEAGIDIGPTFPSTQISASDVNSSYAHTNSGFGIYVTKFFSHTMGAQLNFINATVSGQDKPSTGLYYGFTTHIHYDVTINAIAHIGNIRFLSRTPNIGIYATAGVGLINFSPYNDSAGIPVNHNYTYNGYYGYPQPANFLNTTEYLVPFSVGARYLLSDRVSINFDYSYRAINTYKLAGFWVHLSQVDTYTYSSIGITYYFGKQKEIIEWTNPVDNLYNSFYAQLVSLRKSIDSLEKDTDGDGVSDYFDKDNNTPKGFMVYGNGTAVDFDGDGVPDAIDWCPTVPGPASNHGCPIATVEKVEIKKQPTEVSKPAITNEEEEIISQVFKNLQFETGKSVIRESSYLSLNDLANLLKKKPAYKLLIEGHTDNVGGAAANMKLSIDRSNSVKKYLMDKGIEESRLITKGYGLTKPVADNKTPEGRQMNRRVDFTIVQ